MTLSDTQLALMERCAVRELAPYGGQWSTFYRLKSLGLMQYSPQTAGAVWMRIQLTDEGRAALAKARGEP